MGHNCTQQLKTSQSRLLVQCARLQCAGFVLQCPHTQKLTAALALQVIHRSVRLEHLRGAALQDREAALAEGRCKVYFEEFSIRFPTYYKKSP